MPDKSIITGGPAFPVFPPEAHAHVESGMTLRDYFAAAALKGMLANPSFDFTAEGYVSAAYNYAGLMLERR
jgi:hypothetical protein